MPAIMEKGTIKTLTMHYIDGSFIESHGRQVMDIIKPTNGQVIARVTLGDEEDTRRAIAAAKRAFAGFGRTSKEERLRYLRQLHKAVSDHVDDLTAVIIEEYGGVASSPGLLWIRGSTPLPQLRRGFKSCR
jgi:aldehyde dehydrogenase (NAD+)